MEQMSAPEVGELFEDEKFYNWYRAKYLRVGRRQFSRIRRSPKASPMPPLPNCLVGRAGNRQRRK